MQQNFDIILNIDRLEIFKHKIKGCVKMQNSALFRGLTDSEYQKMLKNLGAKLKNCNTNETIMSYNENPDYLYVVLSGSAELASYDYDGNKSILERYSCDSVFGEKFFYSLSTDELVVSATSSCSVLYFKYTPAIFENVSKYHAKFLDNLFSMVAKKSYQQSQHIDVLSKRTIREKLTSYFEIQAQENLSFSFSLPMSLSALADYLSIDRSAMQRELKRLNDEGLIISKGKKITVIRK